VDYIFQEDIEYDPSLLVGSKMDKALTVTALGAALAVLERYADFEDEAAIESELRATAEKLGLKNAQFFGALRVAIAGRTVSLPLMGSLRAMGRDRALLRVRRALAMLA
jgi:glutamyl-tRNA synthetase